VPERIHGIAPNLGIAKDYKGTAHSVPEDCVSQLGRQSK
jgi:hypothetical protein